MSFSNIQVSISAAQLVKVLASAGFNESPLNPEVMTHERIMRKASQAVQVGFAADVKIKWSKVGVVNQLVNYFELYAFPPQERTERKVFDFLGNMAEFFHKHNSGWSIHTEGTLAQVSDYRSDRAIFIKCDDENNPPSWVDMQPRICVDAYIRDDERQYKLWRLNATKQTFPIETLTS